MDIEIVACMHMCVCVCVYIYIYIYIYIKWNITQPTDILPFATTWMDLQDIMLSEIRQRKANTVYYHLYVKYKN